MRKKISWLLVAVFAAGLLFGAVGCANSTVATVNGQKITNAMMDQEVKFYVADYELKYQKTFDPEKNKILYQRFQNQAIKALIARELLLAEADKRGLKATDQEVTETLEMTKKIANQYGGKQGYANYLKSLGLDEAQLKGYIKERKLQSKVDADVTKDIKVSEAEINAYYAANAQKYNGKALAEVKPKAAEDALKAKKQDAVDAFHTELQSAAKIEVKRK